MMMNIKKIMEAYTYWETVKAMDITEPYLLEFIPKNVSYKNILDLGCGEGRTTLPLARIGEMVYGLDGSSQQIKRFRQKIEEGHLNTMQALQGDAKHLPFADHFFDLIISISVVEHIPRSDLHQVFCEAKRVLKPQGIFLVRNDAWFYHILEMMRIRRGMFGAQPDPTHVTMMRGGEFIKRLQRAGFKIIREDHFPFYRYEKKWGIKFPQWLKRIFATHSNFLCTY